MLLREFKQLEEIGDSSTNRDLPASSVKAELGIDRVSDTPAAAPTAGFGLWNSYTISPGVSVQSANSIGREATPPLQALPESEWPASAVGQETGSMLNCLPHASYGHLYSNSLESRQFGIELLSKIPSLHHRFILGTLGEGICEPTLPLPSMEGNRD